MLCVLGFATGPAYAQDEPPGPGPLQPAREIPLAHDAETDEAIAARLNAIYAEIEGLGRIEAEASQGVVILSGQTTDAAAAERATRIAGRLAGVAAVEDRIERDLDVATNLSVVLADLAEAFRSWPLYLLAFGLFVGIALFGHLLGASSALWRRVSPNAYIARLFGQVVRLVFFVAGLMIALGMLGATAFVGAFVGGAGLIGLAIGFAVRDTIENYIASIMLSLRQPFRANDHVVINDHEGLVVRLTSRATVLMTLDGNHLRIPNADVFKAVILNYTRNPERRFDFVLGVDAEDDPVNAMQVGLDAVGALDFVLAEPEPQSIIEKVGDSSIVLRFMGWVNQRDTDFMKARSLAIRAAKQALEEQGFTLPEPIYRLRFDQTPARELEAVAPSEKPREKEPAREAPASEVLDVSPERHLEEKASQERAETKDEDLLDEGRPIE